MLEVNADNYRKILKKNNKSLYNAQLNNVIPDNIPLINLYDVSDSDNFRSNGLNVVNKKNNEYNHVEIHSYNNNLNYWFLFENKKLTFAWIFKHALLAENSPPNLHLRTIVDKLVLKEGYTLKKSELKYGSDILIKEFDDYFIIVDFSTSEVESIVNSISFSTYGKKKYFHLFN